MALCGVMYVGAKKKSIYNPRILVLLISRSVFISFIMENGILLKGEGGRSGGRNEPVDTFGRRQ